MRAGAINAAVLAHGCIAGSREPHPRTRDILAAHGGHNAAGRLGTWPGRTQGRLNADAAFIAALRTEGRERTSAWLRRNFRHIDTRSSFTLAKHLA